MKTLKLTDEELDILQNNLLYLIEDEENNNSLSRDEEYLQNLKSLYLKVSDRDIPKPNEGYKRLGLSTDEIGNVWSENEN